MGPAFVTGLVANAGLPPALGYLVYVGKVVTPMLLIIGLRTRPAAIVVAINMLTAILLVHIDLIAAVSGALLGAGCLSVGGRYGRWN